MSNMPPGVENPELVVYGGIAVLFVIALVFIYTVPRYALNA